MDSLGGILTNGLLGNMILGSFHISLFGAEVVIVVTKDRAGGGAFPGQEPSYLNVKIKFRGREIDRTYELTEKRATFIVKNFSGVRRVINLVSISVSNLVVKPIKRAISIIMR